LVEKQPDIYARELQHALFMAYDVEMDTTTITCMLHRHRFTCKNITHPAREHNEELQQQYQADIDENYPPETLVLLNKATCNHLTNNRLKAWAPIRK